MKRFFLLSTIIISSFGMMNTLSAQGDVPQSRAKKMVVKVNTVAPLSGDQFAKVNAAYVDYFTKHDALDGQKATLSKSDYDSKLQALKTTRDAALKATLDAGQFAQWTAYVQKEKLD